MAQGHFAYDAFSPCIQEEYPPPAYSSLFPDASSFARRNRNDLSENSREESNQVFESFVFVDGYSMKKMKENSRNVERQKNCRFHAIDVYPGSLQQDHFGRSLRSDPYCSVPSWTSDGATFLKDADSNADLEYVM